ncbi:MAG: hypothetical protein RL670_780 [Actinomycetota bacterium]|jgi:hypothetical protein
MENRGCLFALFTLLSGKPTPQTPGSTKPSSSGSIGQMDEGSMHSGTGGYEGGAYDSGGEP